MSNHLRLISQAWQGCNAGPWTSLPSQGTSTESVRNGTPYGTPKEVEDASSSVGQLPEDESSVTHRDEKRADEEGRNSSSSLDSRASTNPGLVRLVAAVRPHARVDATAILEPMPPAKIRPRSVATVGDQQ